MNKIKFICGDRHVAKHYPPIPTAKVRAVSKTSDAPSTPPRAQRPVTLKSGKKGSIAQRLAEIDAEAFANVDVAPPI